MTGLSNEQLTELVARVHAARGGGFTSRGRPYALGLFRSIAMVVCLMRTNVTQVFAGAIFGLSQSTVSRRWDLLRPMIGQVLAEFVPGPVEVVEAGTVLVDGTICPTWDWRHIPDLYSTKAGYPGMNLQIAATLDGHLTAVGLIPVHAARHDAHTFGRLRLFGASCHGRPISDSTSTCKIVAMSIKTDNRSPTVYHAQSATTRTPAGRPDQPTRLDSNRVGAGTPNAPTRPSRRHPASVASQPTEHRTRRSCVGRHMHLTVH